MAVGGGDGRGISGGGTRASRARRARTTGGRRGAGILNLYKGRGRFREREVKQFSVERGLW